MSTATSHPLLIPRRAILVTVLLAAIVGGLVAFGVSYAMRPNPTTQTRDIYLFAVDQNFPLPPSGGLKSDYVFSSALIIANKGDTLRIHFFNPTDKPHSFTMVAPFTNDVVVPNSNTTVTNANITIAANQGGSFPFYCKFHSPQMIGILVLQG